MGSKKVVIEIEAQFVDNASGGANKAKKSMESLSKSATQMKTALNKIGTANVNPKIGANKSDFDRKSTDVQNKLKKLVSGKYEAVIGAVNKGAKAFTEVESGLKRITGKAWRATVGLTDNVTAPIRRIIRSLSSLTGMVGMGLSTYGLIINPTQTYANYEDLISQYKTMLGSSSAAEKRISELTTFASETPYTRDEIYQASKILQNYTQGAAAQPDTGLRTIGNVAAATGQQYVDVSDRFGKMYSLMSSGSSITEQLDSLALMGALTDKARTNIVELANAVKSGTTDMAEAWPKVLDSFSQYDGLMADMSNNTNNLLLGVKSFFKNNVIMKIGSGITSELDQFLKKFRTWRNENKALTASWSASIEKISADLTGKFLGVVEHVASSLANLFGSEEFKNADLLGKIKLSWDALIGDPLSEWWNTKGKGKALIMASDVGTWLGTALTNGVQTVSDAILYAVTGDSKYISDAKSIGSTFWRSFVDAFDGGQVLQAIKAAVGGVWDALPTWAKALVIVTALGKALQGISTITSALHNSATIDMFKSLAGSATNGTGAAGLLGKLGSLVGGTAAAGASAGTLTALGAGTVAGSVIGAYGVYDGVTDLHEARMLREAGKKSAADEKDMTGASKLGFTAAGAAAGTVVLPGVGTAVGAGVGYITSSIATPLDIKRMRDIETHTQGITFATQEMNDAIKDTELTTAELAVEFDRASQTDLDKRFGDIKLSATEVQDVAKNITFGAAADSLSNFSTVASDAANALGSLKEYTGKVNKWMWKANVGFKFSENDKTNFRADIDSFMQSAQDYVENKHYEFNAAVNVLLPNNPTKAGGVIGNADAFYTGLETSLNDLGSQLSEKTNIVLEDGVITLDEAKEVENLQKQIADITNKIANAESDAKLEAIKIKFSGAGITADSFADLQNELQTQIESCTENYDEALTTTITSLNLQLGEGAITQQQYDEAITDATAGYRTNIDSMAANVTNVQLEIMNDAYSDVLGPDGMSKLNTALQRCIKDGIEPTNWTSEEAARVLGIASLNENAADNIRKELGMVVDSLNGLNVDGTIKTTLTPEITNIQDYKNGITGPLNGLNVGTVDATGKIDITPEVDTEAVKSKAISPLRNMGLGSVSASVGVNITPKPKLTTNSTSIKFGGRSQTLQFSLGKHANGGIVSGRQLSWLGEEGTPEAVIPFGAKHRKRALELYETAGRALGVAGHAEGGIIGRKPSYRDDETVISDNGSGGSNSVSVNVGGVTIEVHANDGQTLLESINSEKEKVAEVIAGVFNEVMGAQFSNTPLKA